MGKKDEGKPRGRMSSYAFFVQTCREEHKKKHPGESVVFAEFTKKCAEKWKVRMLIRTYISISLNMRDSLSFFLFNLVILNPKSPLDSFFFLKESHLI